MKILIYISFVMTIFVACKDAQKGTLSNSMKLNETKVDIPATNIKIEDNNSFKIIVADYTYSDAEKDIITKGYIDVITYNPTLKVALAYSTTNNFLNADVYGDINRCFLIDKVAKQIARAQEQLIEENSNCSYILYDCLRPYSVQKIMWTYAKKTHKTEYVANPEKGGRSFHNLGISIDVGLICHNKVLDMGSAFDDFNTKSQPALEQKFLKDKKLTQEHINNRKLLRKYLLQNNFHGITSEWWHFDGIDRKDASKYSVYGK